MLSRREAVGQDALDDDPLDAGRDRCVRRNEGGNRHFTPCCQLYEERPEILTYSAVLRKVIERSTIDGDRKCHR